MKKKITRTQYGLYNPKHKRLMGFSVSSNIESVDGFCNDTTYSLCLYGDNAWLIDDYEKAKIAAVYNTEWYNSSYNTPSSSYVDDGLLVVEVKSSYDVSVDEVKESKYKVYNGMIFINGDQRRVIVATKTKKKAAEIFDITTSHLNNYFSVTGNAEQISIARSKPEEIFVELHDYKNDFVSIEEYKSDEDEK